MIRSAMIGFGLALSAAALSIHPPAHAEQLRGKVAIDGSSTVYPITEAVAEEFGAAQPRVRVTVGISGTGGGFKRFVVGETDISDASRPIKKAEYDAAQSGGISFIELPVAYDGLSIVVNGANTWAKDMTIDELRMIFLERHAAKTWKQVRSQWLDVPIRIYAPGTDSGTFDYFKEVIAGDGQAIRSDMSVSEDDNVLVRGVAGDRGAIGFFGCAYYFENRDKLRAVPIDGGEGPVPPTPETIESGAYQPLSRPLFIYVNARSAERPEVDAFVRFYLEQGPELAEEVGYVRLPDAVYQRVRANFEQRRTGTQFLTAEGEAVRGPLAQVYR